jgi:hypothetical protein
MLIPVIIIMMDGAVFGIATFHKMYFYINTGSKIILTFHISEPVNEAHKII